MDAEAQTDTIDRRSLTSAANSANAGRPGEHYDPQALADSVAQALLTGKRSPATVAAYAQPITEADRKTLARMTGIPAEEFLAQISAKLQQVAHLSADAIISKLQDPENVKLSDANMSLAIAFDKNQAASGRTSSIGSVNIQINSFQASDRSQVLGNLKTLRGDKTLPEAIAV